MLFDGAVKYLLCFGCIYWYNQLKTSSDVAWILILKMSMNLIVYALFLLIPIVGFALSDE